MVKKFWAIALLAITACITVNAQTPDWATCVAPVLYNHCASCHHDGGIAPFSLITYDDAVANATNIAHDVSGRKMPPWPPDPHYSHLAHERLLSQQEIDTLVNWASGSMPEGDLSLAPPVPVFSTTGMIPGTPDFIGTIPTYTSEAYTGDVYKCFVIPSGLLTDHYITGFEAIPGNPAVVHHVLVYADTTGTCRHLDSLSPGPGYTEFGGVGSSSAILLGGWVPGSAPMVYPTGFGVQLPANADIVVQVHYPTGTGGMADSTQVHFFFAPTSAPVRNVYIIPVLNHYTDIDSPLFIAANTTRSFQEEYTLPYYLGDFSLLGIAPHMHLIGQNIDAYGVSTSGDTQKYISIPKWDFHWQGFYMMPKIMKIPAGSTVYSDAFYDNTDANPDNPSSPPHDVSAGEATTDEMMIVYFVFTQYQPGDEDVIIDSTGVLGVTEGTYYRGQQLLDPYPNPASRNIVVKCYLEDPDIGNIDLVDMQGREVQQLMVNQHINNGYSAYTFNVSNVPTGTYLLRMQTSQRILTHKVVIQQ